MYINTCKYVGVAASQTPDSEPWEPWVAHSSMASCCEACPGAARDTKTLGAGAQYGLINDIDVDTDIDVPTNTKTSGM